MNTLIDNSKPLFSTIIPVYNKETHVANSIHSVLSQTFPNFELIIICDPSTDNSNYEVNKFTDPRIRVFHRKEPGPGGYKARNLGIQKATGDWITFLDADDEYLANHLEKTALIIHTHNPDVILSGYILNRNKEFSERVAGENIRNCTIPASAAIRLLHKKNSFVHTNSIALKKNALLTAGGFPADTRYRRGGDVDTWLRVFASFPYTYCSSHISSIYHIDHSGVINDPRSNNGETPVPDTARILVDNKKSELSKETLKEIKTLSNKKTLLMFYKQIQSGVFNAKVLKKIYLYDLTAIQFIKISALMALSPIFIIRKAWLTKLENKRL